jgi:hypothetical protein
MFFVYHIYHKYGTQLHCLYKFNYVTDVYAWVNGLEDYLNTIINHWCFFLCLHDILCCLKVNFVHLGRNF